ncbi:nucleoid-associated protein [Isoptericola sp. b490]|uniref:nucleoid-associated protein n=1 Tax=Actinotalea lenta TaxID=3064654 RepID=UPI002712A475|nr:nucleoid-associated protein [Isoptericola sp. b490]MDO8122670.1 nucleoid-associated protein [Isoptericola sp. b490]
MVEIVKAIVHEIPQGRYDPDGQNQLRLSGTETTLAPRTKRFIEENMLDFALKSPRYVVQDPEASSTTPELAVEILDDADAKLVECSQKIAHNLFAAQTGGSPSGILIVALVRGPDGLSLAILKAEHQEGMQLEQVLDGGTLHFDLRHLDELIIGNNSRVYKIALLHKAEGGVAGEMVDQQNGVAFAAFFLSAFLGCRLAENAEIETKKFVDSALAFANREGLDPAKRARYATAVVAYVQSPADTLEAAKFADDFLDVSDRDDFLGAMPASLVGRVVAKDATLVPGHGAGLRIYGDGIVVSASADALERGALEVLADDDGATVIRLTGAVRRYGLVGAPRG